MLRMVGMVRVLSRVKMVKKVIKRQGSGDAQNKQPSIDECSIVGVCRILYWIRAASCVLQDQYNINKNK